MTQEQLEFEKFYTSILYHIYSQTPVEDSLILEEAYIKTLNTLLTKARQDETVILRLYKNTMHTSGSTATNNTYRILRINHQISSTMYTNDNT